MKTESKNEVIAITNEQAQALVERVNKSMNTISKGYLTVAGDVYKLYESKAYEVLGFSTINELALEKFGMSKAMTYKLIKITKRFFDLKTLKLLPEYANLGFKKLETLCSLKDEQIAHIKEETGDLAEVELDEIQSYVDVAKEKKEPTKPKKKIASIIKKADEIGTVEMYDEICQYLKDGYTLTITISE